MALDERRAGGIRSAYDEGKLVPGAGDANAPPDVDARTYDVGLAKLRRQRRFGYGIGLLKGMAVTLKHLFKHNTVIEYPDEKQDLSPRTRGVIALKEENCTVCMLCARECPDWCIYIDSHKETLPPKRQGGRPRKRNVLDRFAIDYALCMYCGICVEVCPYDALFWSREFEYAELDIRELTHEKERLSDWMATVLPPPELEVGAELPGQEAAAGAPAVAAGAAGPGTEERPSPPATTAAPAERPEQAQPAPAAAATAAPSTEQATESQQRAGETKEVQAASPTPAGQKAPTETPAPPDEAILPEAAQVKVPHEEPRPVALERTEDPQKVYDDVLKEQLDKGSSPQVAEARAKVARVKAERGIKRGPTPVQTEKRVPSAPTKGQEAPPEPSGAPHAEEPKPEQGPVGPTEDTET